MSGLGLPGRGPFSIETVPPSRGHDPDGVLRCIDAIAPYGPAFVSVTDHPALRMRERDGDGGPAIAVSARGKPGTLGLCVAIRERSGLPVVPHLVCAGNDRLRAEDELIDLRYAGFADVFVVRGDRKAGTEPGPDDFPEARDLVAFVSSLNEGKYSCGTIRGSFAGFRIGVAGYPCGHPRAPDARSDLAALAEKARAGADWIATQMVFSAADYLGFVEAARGAGIDLPVVPGIKPVTSLSSLRSTCATFGIPVPGDLARELELASSPSEERRIGILHAAALAGTLAERGAPGPHFFTMGRARDTAETLEAMFGRRHGNEA